MYIEINSTTLLFTIIGTAVAVATAIWGVWRFQKEQYEKGYEKGIEEGEKKCANARFVVKGDEVLFGRDEIMTKGKKLLKEAKSHIKIITVTGAAWMTDGIEKILEQKIEDGVSVKLILIDPDGEIADYISEMELEFTTVQRPVYRAFGDAIRTNINKIKEIYEDIIGSENIRLYPKPFFWKGSIVDGKKAMYTIYDVPRKDTPLRITKNKKVTKHFEKWYFDQIWEASRTMRSCTH